MSILNRFTNLFKRKTKTEPETVVALPVSPEEMKEVNIFSRDQLSMDLGLFPSQVEDTFIELEKDGLIECRMMDGNVYAIVPKGVDLMKAMQEKKQSIMFR